MSLKELVYFNKKKIILGLGLVLAVVVGFVIYYFYDFSEIKSNKLNNIKVDSKLEEKEEEEEVLEEIVEISECYFDIKGEVKTPGVYAIDCERRIIDAINMSGGLTKNSDTSVLNLSKKIEDGMVIIVYSKKEVNDYLNTLKEQETKKEICDSSNIKNDACDNSSNQTSNTTLININTASLAELMTLPGIGETKAKNIIAYREKTLFKSIEDIKQVEGIGESLYASIKENITV